MKSLISTMKMGINKSIKTSSPNLLKVLSKIWFTKKDLKFKRKCKTEGFHLKQKWFQQPITF